MNSGLLLACACVVVVSVPTVAIAGPVCGDSTVDPGEDCDDTDLNGEDCASLGFTAGVLACEPVTCMFDTTECTTCGDGNVETGEECDDGNTTNGDGCSDACEIEAPGTDSGTPPGTDSGTPPGTDAGTPPATDAGPSPGTDAAMPGTDAGGDGGGEGCGCRIVDAPSGTRDAGAVSVFGALLGLACVVLRRRGR